MTHAPSRRLAAWILTLVLAVFTALPATVLAAAETSHKASPAFVFALDRCNAPEVSGTGNLLLVRRNSSLPKGESLTLSGWLSTDRGVTEYRYAWVPAGGGPADWRTVPAENCRIFARADLAGAGIAHASGHATAGFDLTVPPPEDVTDDYYDIYIRAIDGDGAPCDFLALLHLRYGNADDDDGTSRRVNFDRLVAESTEGAAVLQGGASVTDEGLILPAESFVRLGDFDLAGFESAVVTYRTVSGAPAATDGARAVIGLKSSDRHPIGGSQAGYDLTDTLAYALPQTANGRVTLDLSACAQSGPLWLTATGPETLIITEIELIYNGNGTDRVAARIHLSGELLSHFAGQNKVALSGVTDPRLGDVLRIEVTEDTNDPFVHFYAEQVLDEADIRLSADAYQYMVVLARAMPHNNGRHMTFYLCAGSITGATEQCTTTFSAEGDGEWHYYLIDLTGLDTWSGLIHGWRFDIINGDSHAGDAVEYASVQFFRTREAATAAASRPVSEATPYHIGDPVVYPDLCEEQQGDSVLPPEETYIETAPAETDPPETDFPETAPRPPETEPISETGEDMSPEPETTPVSDPAQTTPPEPTTDPQVPPDNTGCRSALTVTVLLVPAVAAIPLLRRRKA